MTTEKQGTKRKAEGEPIEMVTRAETQSSWAASRVSAARSPISSWPARAESNPWMELTSDVDLENLEIRNAVRNYVEECSPVIITKLDGSNGEATTGFLRELGDKQSFQGRYYIWRGNDGEWVTNMPEAIHRRNRGHERSDKAEERCESV